MNRIDRLHAILTMLQSRRVVKAEDIAKRFEISLRTVYRDMRALNESGIPIGAEAGLGYYLMEGYRLPPVMFTSEEARALLLAGKLIEQLSDSQKTRNFNDALTKVKAVLNSEKKDELEGLENKIIINPYPAHKEKSDVPYLDLIEQSLTNNRLLQMSYLKAAAHEHSQRTVEPIGLCYYFNKWHLIAYCRERKDYRDFRVDRIKELKLLDQRFSRTAHPSIKEYLQKLEEKNQLTEVKIHIAKEILPYIQNSKYSMGLVAEELCGEDMVMTFATFDLEYFARWLLMLGTSVSILTPITLKEKYLELLHDIYHKNHT